MNSFDNSMILGCTIPILILFILGALCSDKKILPFDITKKYKTYDNLSPEDLYEFDGIVAPLFNSVYADKYKNTIGKTKSGIEVLISKNEKEVD